MAYDVKALVRDPEFQRLPFNERRAVLAEADPDFSSADQSTQNQVLAGMKNESWWGGGKKAAPMPQNDATWAKNRDKFIDDTGTLKTRVKEKALNVGRNVLPSRQTVAKVVRPTLEGVGAVGGGMLGTPAGPAGTLAGAGLGYAIGKNVADTIEGNYAATPAQAGKRSLSDIATGAALEMGGQAAAPALGAIAKGVGYVTKPVLGKLSGVGKEAVSEAIDSGAREGIKMNPLKSANKFDEALRGDVSGDDIVESARSALNSLKEQRATAYQAKLQEVAQNTQPIDMRPFKQETLGLMNKYNVKASVTVNPKTGQPQLQLDTSRIAMGKTGRKDIEEIIQTIAGWGSKQGDNTAQGLDVLKRQLDDFYSDSSQARQFVTALRNKVKDTIVTNVPQYDEMTKGYSEATKLIKDIEADLMLRKQGMSGRTTADKTLRRLMSSMRDNFEMRRELVGLLGAKGGEDLTGQIAGYTMSTPVPRGLAGTGPLLAGQAAYAQFVNPKFWPVLAASSPRVQGEFLRLFGRAMGEAQKIGPQGAKAAAIGSVVAGQNTTER